MAFTTRSSLLDRACVAGDGGAWEEFVRFYAPFLAGVARRLGLAGQDVDELVQAAVVDVYRARRFVYDRGRGRFRAYLRQVAAARLAKLLRATRRAGEPAGKATAHWADAFDGDLESDYRRHVLRAALGRVRREVEPLTYQAFDLYALQGAAVRRVARFLGVSVATVYQAKHRVVERLKVLVQELTVE